MGVYSEYIDAGLTIQQLLKERQAQLKRISEHRKRDVLVFAADLNKGRLPTIMHYADLLPFRDQLSNLNGKALDLILETPGGYAETAEDIVGLLRAKYDDIAVIVPGAAMSAGTILAMAFDEILMEPASSLGPIDAQLTWQGKSFSADALLQGVQRIKDEVDKSGTLNKAYIPILQGISPGDLQNAENAQAFGQTLVTDWLARYKFRTWIKHTSTGLEVTTEEKQVRAKQIAAQLVSHSHWLTHARSIKLTDLEKMRVKITDYSKDPVLADAIGRYYTLMALTFDNQIENNGVPSTIYKLFETSTSLIMKIQPLGGQQATSPPPKQESVILEAECTNTKCKAITKLQVNLDKSKQLESGLHRFPSNSTLKCPKCGTKSDLSAARAEIERATGQHVVA